MLKWFNKCVWLRLAKRAVRNKQIYQRRTLVNMVLIFILNKTWCDSVDCIYLAQYRDQYRALLGTIMNLRVPQDGKCPSTSGSGTPNPPHWRSDRSHFLKTYLKSGHYLFQNLPKLINHIFLFALRPNAGHGLLIHEVSRSHTRRITVGTTPLDK